MDELISQICDIEQMEVPVSTARRAEQPDEQRTADIAPVRLDMDGPPGQETPIADALADSLAALQAECGQQVAHKVAEEEAMKETEKNSIDGPPDSETITSTNAAEEIAAEASVGGASQHLNGDTSPAEPLTVATESPAGGDAALPADADSQQSPAPLLPASTQAQDSAASQLPSPRVRRSNSRSLSPSPRRRPPTLQTAALQANDENSTPATPASPAGTASPRPWQSMVPHSPGSKPTPKSAGAAQRAPLSPHGYQQKLLGEPALTVPGPSAHAEEQTDAQLPSKGLGVAADSGPGSVGQEGGSKTASSPAAEPVTGDAAHAQLQPSPASIDADKTVVAWPTAAALEPASAEKAAQPMQLAADMETPVRGLRALQGEPRKYADDDLLTPASVVPFPGFGDRTGGGASSPGEATPVTAPRVADPAPFLSNDNVVFSPDTPAEALSGKHLALLLYAGCHLFACTMPCCAPALQ